MTDKTIEIRGVSKIYRRSQFEVRALDNVELDIAEGEFVALMGPSGSGKSTLLHMLAGLDRPTSGRIRVFGADIHNFSERQIARWRNRSTGFIFQSFNLVPVLTAIENVELPLRLIAGISRRERLERSRTALSIVGLGDRMSHYPHQLSGGQEQRVAIARAIVTDPASIMADEPTGNLDAKAAVEVMNVLAELNRKFRKTVILVTHDTRAAAAAHSVYHLEKGRLKGREENGTTLPDMAVVEGAARDAWTSCAVQS